MAENIGKEKKIEIALKFSLSGRERERVSECLLVDCSVVVAAVQHENAIVSQCSEKNGNL